MVSGFAVLISAPNYWQPCLSIADSTDVQVPAVAPSTMMLSDEAKKLQRLTQSGFGDKAGGRHLSELIPFLPFDRVWPDLLTSSETSLSRHAKVRLGEQPWTDGWLCSHYRVLSSDILMSLTGALMLATFTFMLFVEITRKLRGVRLSSLYLY